MADATPSRLGQVEATGATDTLFLKLFGGEVLTAFETATVTGGRFMERSIPHGKSAQFPATWKNTAAYHTAGAEILGSAIKHDEIVVTIDELLISSTFVAEIDELKNHYDVRSIYTNECGVALATEKDKNILRCGLLASASAATFASASPAGTVTTHASMKVDATVLAAGFFSAAQTFAENDVPASQKRSGFLRPAQYFLLAANKDLLNKDWGGQGSFATAELPQVAGIELVPTNNLPITNESSSASVLDKYEGNWSKTAALIATSYATATVKLRDLAVQSQYDVRRQGTLIVAKFAMGHAALRPECAVQLATP